MWEKLGLYFLGAGAVLLLAGYVWLVVAAFRQRLAWGLATLLILPAPVFVLLHFRKSLAPFLILLLGVVVGVTPIVFNRLFPERIDLGPRERQVDGELHITLTGWEPKNMDYSVLNARPQTVVLQMANEDVTDQTLEHLKGLTRLRELDLSNSQITDAGLKALQALPALEKLHLNNTHISDAGVRESLFPIESLKELNVRKTPVTKKTRDEWKTGKEGRKVTPAF
jgi:Leucine Rich repeats (2 copies)